MPATTKFIDGSGPVWSGSLFPFLFITIACGAVSAARGSATPSAKESPFAPAPLPSS